jgi:hypothetical protein
MTKCEHRKLLRTAIKIMLPTKISYVSRLEAFESDRFILKCYEEVVIPRELCERLLEC